jgi:putative RecB family exonuclease
MIAGLLGFEEVQQRQGGVWEYISPSRLNCWLSCPLKWKLRYLDGIRTPTTPALFVGKAVHAGLEVYYRHRQLGVTLESDDVMQRMLQSWAQLVDEEKMDFDSVDQEQELRRQAMSLVSAYLAYAPGNEYPLAVEVAAEATLVDPQTGENLGICLVGVIDLVLNYEQGPLITDFKTAARSSEPMEISNEIQLSSYAWLHRQVTGQQEGGLEIRSLIKTKQPKVEFHSYPARTDAHFRRLFAVIREYLDALDSGRFNFRPGLGCGMCDFRNTHCARWAG